MNDYMFVLVSEDKPNSYSPIYLPIEDPYNIKAIDDFTSQFSKEELRKYLINQNLLDDNDNDSKIIYNNNGIRKLKSGVIYEEDFVNNKALYIVNFIKFNRNNKNIMNELLQRIKNERLISKETKEYFYTIISNNNFDYDTLMFAYKDILSCKYIELRIIYLYIRNELELKIKRQKNLVLNK